VKREPRPRKSKATQRRAGRPRGGSAALVRAILAATLAELRMYGFDGLSVERIARAARVNKTSIYRRFPDRNRLVLAAWLHWREAHSPAVVEAGDVRVDIARMVAVRSGRLKRRDAIAFSRAIMAMDGREVVTLANELHRTGGEAIVASLAREQERGTIARDAPLAVATEMLLALVNYRAMWRKQPLRDADIEAAVAVILDGVRSRGSARRPM
jgi:AcrR family transcriptional regulator